MRRNLSSGWKVEKGVLFGMFLECNIFSLQIYIIRLGVVLWCGKRVCVVFVEIWCQNGAKMAFLRRKDLEFVISNLDSVEIDPHIAEKALNNVNHVFSHVSGGGVSERP